MGIISSLVDAIVLLLMIVLIPRSVLKGLSKGPGSLLLSICVAAFVIIFAVVSFTALVNFLQSTLAQIIWTLVLLVMAYIIHISWTHTRVE